MTTVAAALKAEIVRVSRKEIRSLTESIRKATAQYRREIAALKRKVRVLEREVSSRRRTVATAAARVTEESGQGLRFSAKGLVSHRGRLGLSAHDMGKLLGVSGQTVYNWEQKKAIPRASQLPAIAALRLMSKKTAQSRLESQE